MSPLKIWAVARREFSSYFVSPTIYALMVVYLFLIGYFMSDRIFSGQADLNISLFSFLLFFIVPLLTMRLVSPEYERGTIELIFTSPVTAVDYVLGKFLAALSVYGVILIFTLHFPLFLMYVGNPDVFVFGAQYLGLALVGSFFLSVGLFCSTLTENQIVAAVSSFFLLLFLWALGILKGLLPTSAGPAIEAISIVNPIGNFQDGLLKLQDVVYFLSLTIGFLFASIQYLNTRSWEN
ncbi:MAG: ABC transporter permease [bacterium]